MSRHWITDDLHFGIIGYGEVGKILAEDLVSQGIAVSAFDIALLGSEQSQAMLMHAAQHGVTLLPDLASLCKTANFLISAVTAHQALEVASACASHDLQGCAYMDINSVSPSTKAKSAVLLESAGASFIEASVMTSVPPYRIRVPMLLGGLLAEIARQKLGVLGFSCRVASDRLGVASATKMCRSIIIKGMEALMIEALVSARHYGVEESVIESLYETFPGVDWEKESTYFFQRVIQHGRRRSEEVREAAITVRDVGLNSHLASGTAERQAWMAELADKGIFVSQHTGGPEQNANWRHAADNILQSLRER